jgi:hypothetical protein
MTPGPSFARVVASAHPPQIIAVAQRRGHRVSYLVGEQHHAG